MVEKTNKVEVHDGANLWPDYKRRLERAIEKQLPHIERSMRFIQGIPKPMERNWFTIEIRLRMDIDSDERVRINKLVLPIFEPPEVWKIAVFGSYVDGIEGVVKFDYPGFLPRTKLLGGRKVNQS